MRFFFFFNPIRDDATRYLRVPSPRPLLRVSSNTRFAIVPRSIVDKSSEHLFLAKCTIDHHLTIHGQFYAEENKRKDKR